MTTTETVAAPRYRVPKLTKGMAAEIIIWTAVLSHLVKWAVDALYFLITQVRYIVGYKATTITLVDIKQFWDNLPYYTWHIVLRQPLAFGDTAHYAWWITVRHDIRGWGIGVGTGIAVTFLIADPLKWKPKAPGFLTTRLHLATRRQQRRTTAWQYLALIPVVIITGLPGLALGTGLILLFPALNHYGAGVPGWATQFSDFLAAGKWQVFVLGLLSSQLFAKYFSLKPAADALRFFVERRVDRDRAAGRATCPRLRLPNYRRLYDWYMDNDIPTEDHGPALARLMAAALPVVVFLIGFGFWLTQWGPASKAA